MWGVARTRWEGEPRCTFVDIAELLTVSKQAVAKRADREGWVKKLNMSELAERAHVAADAKIASEGMSANNAVLAIGDAQTDIPTVSTVIPANGSANPDTLARAVEDAAVDARAQILKRHRTEWAAARSQIYKALKTGDNDGAKLAKLTGETLKLIQDGERKAWGLDNGESEAGSMRIIVERHEGVRIVR
jgi:hypothetical protein